MRRFEASVKEIIENKEIACPLPLSIIPNQLGINLVGVSSVEWGMKDDNQDLEFITINFKE